MSVLVSRERIEQTILLFRSHKVILDLDLAAMYGVSTRDLNKAVSRNADRFPDDFMLQLTCAEFDDLKFQFGTSNRQLIEPSPSKSRGIGFKGGHGDEFHLPY